MKTLLLNPLDFEIDISADPAGDGLAVVRVKLGDSEHPGVAESTLNAAECRKISKWFSDLASELSE